MGPLKILIGCEESQEVCKAFRILGHEAYSCDLQDSSGGHPEWHIQDDVIKLLNYPRWDLSISFPPCTDLAVSGARWFEKKRLSGEQRRSIIFFLNVWRNSNCTENPIGNLNTPEYIKKWFPELYKYALFIGFPFKPSQIIQPWQFGQGEQKSTCLWLRDLPLLKPTNIVSGREQRIWKMPPSKYRAKLRSKTYPGIASAMALQWSEYILNQK